MGGRHDRRDRTHRRQRDGRKLTAATADPRLDFSPPTDDRPFFFNMLKPAAFARAQAMPAEGMVRGNIYATTTLVVLFLITSGLVLLMIVCPLVAHGRPTMPGRAFAAALVYFAGIGLGFMLVQMAVLQRFSIYLGHPTYTLSITLFSMILFAGLGSGALRPCRAGTAATRACAAARRRRRPAAAPRQPSSRSRRRRLDPA